MAPLVELDSVNFQNHTFLSSYVSEFIILETCLRCVLRGFVEKHLPFFICHYMGNEGHSV